MYVWRHIKARSRNHFCRGKEVSIIYFCVCVCGAGAREFDCVCVRVWMGVHGRGRVLQACSLTNQARNAPPYYHLRPLWLHHIFQHCLINGIIFGKKIVECKTCISLQLLFKTFLILKRIQRDVINVKTFSCKVPVILTDFNANLGFRDRVLEKAQISNFI
jgi:hypothetical protein